MIEKPCVIDGDSGIRPGHWMSEGVFLLDPLPTKTPKVPRPVDPSDGFVYFLWQQSSNYLKIGRSNAPLKRMWALQTANPEKLIPAFVTENKTPWTEQELHRRFEKYR